MTSSNNQSFAFLDHMSENEMRFHIEGVRCQKCLAKIYNLRDELPGISSLQINMGIQQLTVKIDKKKLLYSEFAQAITNLGYELKPLQNSSEAEEMIKQKNRRSLIGLAVAATATGNIMLLSTANYAGAVDDFAIAFDWISFVLFLPILLYSAQPFWQSFFNFLKTFTVNIDLTIITAIILGTTFSAYNLVNDSGGVYFDSMAMLLLLLLSSRYLLDRIQQNYLNTNYLTPLLLETAVDVWIPCSNKYESRPVKNLVRGDLVLLQKDQSVPVDGKVTKEGAFFNTAVITGESKPQYIDVNQTVFAGSRLLSEQVELAVEKVGGATRMGTLLAQLSEQIQTHTQLTSQLNKVAQVFTVSIITLSFIIVSYFSIFDLSEGIQRALALVILACPCALALAVPLTQSLGLIKASKEGVIIKDANVLHNLLNIKNFVFDKTGTLTKGEFNFIKWQELTHTLNSNDYAIIHALEEKARHPLAKALLQETENRFLQPIKISQWKEVFGQGVSGYFLEDFYELKAAPDKYANNNVSTAVGFYKNSQLLAVAHLGDQLLPHARKIVQRLKKQAQVYLVTGDNTQSAHFIAKSLNIPLQNVIAKASPEDKVKFISSLPNSAMIGDGANDAVALSKADIGIAVKGSMSASLKAANVYFTVDGIEHLHKLLDISVLFEKTVRGHMWFSAVYNILGALAAIMGLVNPLIAALLMPASSLTVLFTSLNGMKSFKFKKPKNIKTVEALT